MCLFLHHSSWNFLLFKDDCVEWNVTELDISIIDDGNEQNSDLKQSKQFLANSV